MRSLDPSAAYALLQENPDAVLVDSIIEVTKIYKSYKNINLT